MTNQIDYRRRARQNKTSYRPTQRPLIVRPISRGRTDIAGENRLNFPDLIAIQPAFERGGPEERSYYARRQAKARDNDAFPIELPEIA